MEFDPNNLPVTKKRNYTFQYATYVPSRSPKFKVHGTKGLASSALRCHGWCYGWHYRDLSQRMKPEVTVWKLVEGKWIKLERIQTDTEPGKGQPLWKE